MKTSVQQPHIPDKPHTEVFLIYAGKSVATTCKAKWQSALSAVYSRFSSFVLYIFSSLFLFSDSTLFHFHQ